MKNAATIIVLCFLSTTLYSTSLNWKNNASLYDHLVEVNKEWLNISDDEFLCEDMIFENDGERIKMHLKLVEGYLRQNPPKHLDEIQIKNRNAALDILNAYWKTGIFPQNTYHQTRQPYFVDNYGTACAVGYLALKTGETALVKQIAKEMNFAYIAELEDHYPQLLNWAKKYGFTIEELAWIQPGYPPINQTWNTVGNGGGCNGEIKVMKAFGDEMLYFGGEFSEIDGAAANSIVGWDGNEWHTLGEGVTGVVNDIAIDDEGRVFIGGSFTLNEDPSIVNIAYWYDGGWHGFDTGEMNNSIFAVKILADRLFIGGSFEIKYQTDTIKYLAYLNIGESIFENQNGDFSVDASVYDIVDDGNQLYVSGNFMETATYSSNNLINQFQTENIATWGFDENIGISNWIQAFDHELETSIYRLFLPDTILYVGASDNINYSGLGMIEDSIWEYRNLDLLIPTDSSFINGFIKHNDFILVYGNIVYYPIVGVWSNGIYVINATNSLNSEGATFNAGITAAESFQEQIYFAGDFTIVQGQEFPGLVSTPFDGLVPIHETPDLPNFNVYASASEIHVQHQVLKEDVTFRVYNLSGQLINQKTLKAGTSASSMSTQSWVAGMYVYQLVGNGFQESGKLAVF